MLKKELKKLIQSQKPKTTKYLGDGNLGYSHIDIEIKNQEIELPIINQTMVNNLTSF